MSEQREIITNMAQEAVSDGVYFAEPAAGPWVKIEPGVDMPDQLDKCLLCSDFRDFGVGSWVDDMEAHNSFWFGVGLTFEPTHYAIINPPEATE